MWSLQVRWHDYGSHVGISLLICENKVKEHSRFLPPAPSQNIGGSNKEVKSVWGFHLRYPAGTFLVNADTRHALHTAGNPGAAVSVFQ